MQVLADHLLQNRMYFRHRLRLAYAWFKAQNGHEGLSGGIGRIEREIEIRVPPIEVPGDDPKNGVAAVVEAQRLANNRRVPIETAPPILVRQYRNRLRGL